MTKPKSNAARLSTPKASKAKSREQSVLAACKSPTRPKTKHGRIIAMLRTPAGATIAAIMTATDWQQPFRAWISCRCRPQETRAQPCFRANRQGTLVSHQGWQGFARRRGPG